jgi:hypothetical protein
MEWKSIDNQKELDAPLLANEQVAVADWTESEWFEEWLKLARGEYEEDTG